MRFPRHPVLIARNLIQGPPPPGIPKKTLKPYLPADAVIVEAGAHDGSDTVQLSKLWPRGRICAFEPIPAVYAQLTEKVKRRRNVDTWPFALADREGVEPMFVGSGRHDASSSLLAPQDTLSVFPDVKFNDTKPVRVTTLQQWAEMEGIDRVDGMWLDMQGMELAALTAAGPILDTVRAMVIEMSFVPLYAEAPLWDEVREWLEGEGFEIVIEDRYHEATGDALAVR